MQNIVGVRFKQAGKIYYFASGGLDLKAGDEVIAETGRGLEFGKIILPPNDVEDAKIPLPLRAVIRLATTDDRKILAENKEREKEAFRIANEKIAEHGLVMKLVSVEFTFDVNKIVFYFTADGRVDFRELVKDLASVFRTRIELRQIGVRDEAKMMGGIGCCGRTLCCATFLDEFVPVSIRMAKEQNLSLNPAKISGICGRLMCCLKYENDCYVRTRKERRKIQPPRQGSRVATAEGDGKVISLNEQRRTAMILLDNNKTIVQSWEDIIEKDDEITPEEMAAAVAVATMLQERERQTKELNDSVAILADKNKEMIIRRLDEESFDDDGADFGDGSQKQPNEKLHKPGKYNKFKHGKAKADLKEVRPTPEKAVNREGRSEKYEKYEKYEKLEKFEKFGKKRESERPGKNREKGRRDFDRKTAPSSGKKGKPKPPKE